MDGVLSDIEVTQKKKILPKFRKKKKVDKKRSKKAVHNEAFMNELSKYIDNGYSMHTTSLLENMEKEVRKKKNAKNKIDSPNQRSHQVLTEMDIPRASDIVFKYRYIKDRYKYCSCSGKDHLKHNPMEPIVPSNRPSILGSGGRSNRPSILGNNSHSMALLHFPKDVMNRKGHSLLNAPSELPIRSGSVMSNFDACPENEEMEIPLLPSDFNTSPRGISVHAISTAKNRSSNFKRRFGSSVHQKKNDFVKFMGSKEQMEHAHAGSMIISFAIPNCNVYRTAKLMVSKKSMEQIIPNLEELTKNVKTWDPAGATIYDQFLSPTQIREIEKECQNNLFPIYDMCSHLETQLVQAKQKIAELEAREQRILDSREKKSFTKENELSRSQDSDHDVDEEDEETSPSSPRHQSSHFNFIASRPVSNSPEAKNSLLPSSDDFQSDIARLLNALPKTHSLEKIGN